MWIGQFGPPSSRKRKNATDTTPSAYIPIPKPQCGAAIKQQRSEEDFVNVMRVRMGEERLRFFGVFDGHDGKDRVNSSHVAHHVCNTLPRRLFDTVTNPTVCNLDKEVEVMEAIKTVVLHLDREMYESEQFHAGTCCTALLIDDKRHVMYPINLGDSRTILFCYPSQHILFVTKDHDWESEIESARARAAGASIRYGRMNYGLNVSRTFGDFACKFSLSQKYDAENGAVCALPTITPFTIPQDEQVYALLCSDSPFEENGWSDAQLVSLFAELWESRNSSEVPAAIQHKHVLAQIAAHMVSRIINRGFTSDDTSIVLVDVNSDLLGQNKTT